MMVFSIFDNLSGIYSTPMFFRNESEAERFFSNLVNNKNESLVYTNPEDYSLYKLGTFDERTGVLNSEYVKINNALAYKKKGE